MSNAISGRLARRFTAMGAGAALVAAGLSLGVMAPANAVSVVTGGVTDGFGNPISGYVDAYLQDPDSGQFFFEDSLSVGNDGYIEDTLATDGVYKFEFTTFGDYSEYYEDAADEATATPVNVAGGASVALGAWTIDQPYILGTVTNAAGKPLPFSSIRVFDAATGDSLDSSGADEKGAFKFPTQAAPVKVSFSAGSDYALEYYADAGDLASASPITATSTGANLGNITLAPAGSISGQVTSDAGAPLEFVRVEIDDDDNNNLYDYTDKNGVYTIKNAPTGPQIVEFSDPIGEYSSEFFNNVTDPDLATPVTVGVGQAVPSVNAALTPRPVDPTRTVEVTGAVKDNLGVPVVGALLTATGTPANPSDRQNFESTYSNRQGNYAFTELEKVQGENQFKISAGGNSGIVAQGDDNAFVLYGSWYGGGQDYDRAPAVTVTPGTAVGAVDFNLERAGGIAGSVTGLAGAPLSPSVSAFGPKDGQFASLGIDFKTDSTFESRSLRPGTYKIRFDDYSGFHAGEWWKDQAQVDDAVLITVKPGQMVGGLNAVLGNQLTSVERPTMSADYPWVGKAITADPGSWNLMTDTDFNYEWLVGSTVVGKGEVFTPTTANIGGRLVLRVTAENGRLIGTAASAGSPKIGYQPKIKVKVKGATASLKIKASPVKAKKVKGTVVVKEIVKVKDDETIKYKKVAKAKIKKGKGTVSLSKLKKGKHKLVFVFTGKGKVGSNEETLKVKR